MPQMAPINWLILFFMFTTTFFLFNMMNFFMIMYNPYKTTFKNKKINMINWKW